jgi:hypothetical protein
MILGDSCASQGIQDGRLGQARWQLLSSLTRYLLEAILRGIALIEAFAKIIGLQLPGQCIGDPEDVQGDVQDGNCKPEGAGETLHYGNTLGGINSQKLGDVLVSLLTFIVDALIGMGRLGCTELCNTDSEFTTANGVQAFDPPDPCTCWNYSPYYSPVLIKCAPDVTGIAYLLLGCDTTSNTTDFVEASRPGGCGWATGDPRYCSDPAFLGGLSKFIAISTTNGCGIPEAMVPDGGYPFKRNIILGSAILQNPYRRYETCSMVSTGDPGCDSTMRRRADRLLPLYDSDTNLVPACYRIIPENHIGETLTAFNSQLQLHEFELKPCVDLGMCKNDQNVRCTNFSVASRGFVLDGMIRAALFYLKCLLTNIFSIALPIVNIPGAPAGLANVTPTFNLAKVVDPILFFLSIIWQLSGGIIKFAVAVFLLLLNFITKSPWSAFWTALGDTFGLLNTFIKIFTQPLILIAKKRGEPASERWTNAEEHESHGERGEHLLFATWEYVFGGAEAAAAALESDEELINCFCKYLDLNPDCTFNMATNSTEPSGLTTTDVLMYVAGRFEGVSVCDRLVQSCSGMAWADVPEPEKYTYLQCVAGKVKGQRVKQLLGSDTFPDNFFVSERGWVQYFENIAGQAQMYVKKDAHKRYTTLEKHNKQRAEDWSDAFQLLPDEYQKHVRKQVLMAKNILVEDKVVRKDSLVLEPISEMAAVWFKYNTGYYHFLGRQAINRWHQGVNIIPSYRETFDLMLDGINDLSTGWNTTKKHIGEFGKSSLEAYTTVGHLSRELWNNGFANMNFPQPKLPEGEVPIHPREFINRMPIVKNWKKSPDDLPIKKMFKKVTQKTEQLTNWTRGEWDKVTDRMTTLSWHQTNWDWGKTDDSIERVKRVMFKPFYWLWPHHVTDELHQRFVLEGDGCKIIDGAVNLAAERVDYCVNQYMFNIPERYQQKVTRVHDYINYSASQRRGSYLNKNHHRVKWTKSPSSANVSEAYIRPRLILPEEEHDRFHGVDPRIKKRILYHERSVSGGFESLVTPGGAQNLYQRVICWIESVFNIDLTGGVNDFFEKFEEWVENPNTGYDNYPDVGLQFWVQFFFRCENPENLNCGIGVGLEEGIKQVTSVFIVVILVGVFVIPGFLALLGGGLSMFIIYLVALMIVSFHWSPFCLYMTPSFFLRPGLVLPLLPMPISTMAFPECLWVSSRFAGKIFDFF